MALIILFATALIYLYPTIHVFHIDSAKRFFFKITHIKNKLKKACFIKTIFSSKIYKQSRQSLHYLRLIISCAYSRLPPAISSAARHLCDLYRRVCQKFFLYLMTRTFKSSAFS